MKLFTTLVAGALAGTASASYDYYISEYRYTERNPPYYYFYQMFALADESCDTVEDFVPIQNQIRCEFAADFLNLGDTSARVVNSDTTAPGCSVNARGSLRMNVALDSVAHLRTGRDRKVICERSFATQPYTMTDIECDGTVLCVIEDAEECQSAANWVSNMTPQLQPSIEDIDHENIQVVDKPNLVAGCSTDKNYNLVFNENLESAVEHRLNKDRNVLCKECQRY